jgi:hypothetical protein
MSKPEKNLRQELMEARARVLQQIEICANNPPSNFATAGGGEAPAPTPIADLEATLKEIDDAIANLAHDPRKVDTGFRKRSREQRAKAR